MSNILVQMLDNLYEGIYFVDIERTITFWNKGAENITGFLASEVIGNHCYNNILNHIDDKGTQLCFSGCPLHKTLEDESERNSTVYLHHKDGYRLKVNIKVFPIYDDNNELVGAAEVFVTDKNQFTDILDDEALRSLAFFDQLTGIANRRNLESVLNSKLSEFKMYNYSIGIALLDIDHFKSVNDTYGHDVGDEVLKMVSKTLDSSVRSIDTCGRWGGEEFLIIFPHVNESNFTQILDRILILVSNSKLRNVNLDTDVSVTISIGASIVQPGDTKESLLKNIDEKLYTSKREGRNRYTL